MQTILGAGGIIGQETARALIHYTDQIRLVARNPKKVNDSDQVVTADLTHADQVMKAVEGSDVVYLTVGLQYDLKIWQSTWPVIMTHVINACLAHKSKLVFFDNVYMYGSDQMGLMTEKSVINPPSEKGKIRAQIAQQLMDAVEKQNLTALIARAADFYGPGNKSSVLVETVFKPLMAGKKANVLCSVDHVHSFTYTPDAGKATALLGNTSDAFNQVWHLPTAKDPWTMKRWIENFAALAKVQPKYMVAGHGMVKLLGWFMPIMKELHEMLYQNDRDYIFDSNKFITRFKTNPTPYDAGLKATYEDFR